MEPIATLDKGNWEGTSTVVAAFIDMPLETAELYINEGSVLYDIRSFDKDFLIFDLTGLLTPSSWEMSAVEYHREVYEDATDEEYMRFSTQSNNNNLYGEVLL